MRVWLDPDKLTGGIVGAAPARLQSQAPPLDTSCRHGGSAPQREGTGRAELAGTAGVAAAAGAAGSRADPTERVIVCFITAPSATEPSFSPSPRASRSQSARSAAG